MAIQWTNRNQAFIFANIIYHGFQAWWISWALHLENFTKQMTHRSSRSLMFFRVGVIKNFTNFTGVFFVKFVNVWNHLFLQITTGGCFLTQLLLHRKMHFSEIASGISPIKLINIYTYLLNFCILSCNSSLKSHRSNHPWWSIKKALQYSQESTRAFN